MNVFGLFFPLRPRTAVVGVGRICPAHFRHRPIDRLTGTRLVIFARKLDLHRRHDRTAHIDVGHLARIDADIAVTRLPASHALYALTFQGVQPVAVVGGKLRRDVIDLAARKGVERVARADDLETKLFGLHLELFAEAAKIVVLFEIYDVTAVELSGRGIVFVVFVGGDKGTCTYGNSHVTFGLDYLALIGKGTPIHAEFIACDIDLSAVGILLVRRVVMRGRDGKAEVINRFGIGALHGNLQYVVLALVGNGAVVFVGRVPVEIGFVVIMRHLIFLSVDRNGSFVGGMSERNDARNVGIFEPVRHFVLKENFFRLRLELRHDRVGGTPARQNLIEFLLHIIRIYVLDRFFFRIISVEKAHVVEALDDVFIVLAVDFFVLRRNEALVIEKLEYVVFEMLIVRPFFIGQAVALQIVSVLRRLEIGFQLFFEKLADTVVVVGKHVAVIGGAVFPLRGVAHGGGIVARRIPFLDKVEHLLLGHVIRRRGGIILFTRLDIDIDQFLPAAVGKGNRLLGGVRFGALIGLHSVGVKSLDFGRIHGGRTRINGIEILVHIEEHVVHREGIAVGEQNVVFQYKRIDGIAVRLRNFVIEHHGRFVFAAGRISVVVRSQHADLRHADNVHIGARRRIKRIEQAVQLLRHQNDTVLLVFLLTARKRITGGRDEHCAQRKR